MIPKFKLLIKGEKVNARLRSTNECVRSANAPLMMPNERRI
jgi:hypothetical protein